MEGTFLLTELPPDNYSIRLANAPQPAVYFAVNKPEWYDKWQNFLLDIRSTEQEDADDSYNFDVDVEFRGSNEVTHGNLQINIKPL